MKILPAQAALMIVILCLVSLSVHARMPQNLYYDVYLDGDKIGYHKVSIIPGTAHNRVQVEASFTVSFLFFNAYAYHHSADEVWRDNCLKEILARTDDNGTRLFVNGRQQNNVFRIESVDGVEQLRGCVKSFAYWDPSLIQATHLLNTQNGRYMPVRTVWIGDEKITVAGKKVKASHYQIISDEFVIDLWYSADQEWLALNTTTENGAKLRYERR